MRQARTPSPPTYKLLRRHNINAASTWKRAQLTVAGEGKQMALRVSLPCANSSTSSAAVGGKINLPAEMMAAFKLESLRDRLDQDLN
jgi:hypothetical protein